MKIEFYGDLTCPWSHLGWRRLGKALLQNGLKPSENRLWRPYQLNPDLPLGGIDRQDYLLRKFGNADRVREVTTTITAAMQTEGLHVNMEHIRVISNTSRAHRLMCLAQEHNKADALLEEFFIAYFVMGLDLGEPNILRELAMRMLLPPDRIEEELTAESPLPAMLSAEASATTLGIRAVPFIFFNDRYSIAGAHDPIAFTPLIELCMLQSKGHKTEKQAS